jgi:hypothetical protein
MLVDRELRSHEFDAEARTGARLATDCTDGTDGNGSEI